MLAKLERTLQALVNWSLQKPVTVCAFYLITLIFLIMQFRPFRLLITADDLVNKDFKSYQQYQDLKENFDLKPSLNVVVHTHKPKYEALSNDDFCRLKVWRSNTVFLNSFMHYCLSPLELRGTRFTAGVIPKLFFPKLVHPHCGNKESLRISDLLKDTPWNDSFSVNNSEVMFSFTLHEPDQSDVDDKHPQYLNFRSKVIPRIVGPIMKATKKMLANFKVLFSGEASYYYYMSKGLKFNSLLNLIIIILVIICFKFFLGFWKSGLIFVGSLVVGSLYLFSMMSLTDTPIDVLNNALFLLLTVSTMGDFIYLSITQIKHPDISLGECFKRNTLPSFFTSLTTFIGFISLGTSELDIVNRFGIWAAISGVIEWLIMFTLLPAILQFIPRIKKENKIFWIKPTFTRVGAFLEKLQVPRGITQGLLLIIIVIPWSLQKLNINDSPDELFGKGHPYTKAMQYIADTRHYKGEVSLVFSSNLTNREQINRILERVRSNPLVTRIESPYAVIDYLHHDIPKRYYKLIDRGLHDTIFYKRLIHDEKVRAIAYLKAIDLQSINQFQNEVSSEICKSDCYLSGLLITYSEFSAQVPVTLIKSLRTSLICVFGIIFILGLMKKEKNLFKLLATSFWGIGAILLVIALFQVKINFVTCIVVSTLVGLTGDNAIHFLFGANGLDQGVKEKDLASIITALVMAICSLTFLFSAFAPPRIFGLLLCTGFLLSLFGDLFMLKALLKKNRS